MRKEARVFVNVVVATTPPMFGLIVIPAAAQKGHRR